MADRAQDTEAIRAARDEAAIVARGILNVKGSGDAAVAALGRLVARLEAAEQALAYVVAQERYWLVGERARRMADIARAALAAAAPGETAQTP